MSGWHRDEAELCEETGRCLEWWYCYECRRCYCECTCAADDFSFRDEWGQGKRGSTVTLAPRPEYL